MSNRGVALDTRSKVGSALLLLRGLQDINRARVAGLKIKHSAIQVEVAST